MDVGTFGWVQAQGLQMEIKIKVLYTGASPFTPLSNVGEWLLWVAKAAACGTLPRRRANTGEGGGGGSAESKTKGKQ